MRRAAALIETAVLGQRGHLFPWVPVCLAIGIGLYFMLRTEPPIWVLVAAGLAGLAGLLTLPRVPPLLIPSLAALSLIATGLALAGARAHWVAGPTVDFRYYGPIEGRIVGIDRSASDAVRLTLDRVVLERFSPEKTPHRVRVSLHGDQRWIRPVPGQTVILTGHLSAPRGAVEPGGFDFRRHAWFQRLGAVGYTRNPVLELAPPTGGLLVTRARMALSSHVQAALPGEAGAFAAAVMSGDRSGMGQGTLQALRDSNLAHLLAISGLHMGLLAGVVFAGLRLVLLVLPGVGLRWPVKKIAALGALVVAALYLALSGGNVATERAFVMVAVVLGAVLVDRRALSLRAVAMAALIVLVLRPESLLSPGFQMSFAATTALVAVFAALRDLGPESRLPGWARPVVATVISSAVAGLATAPVAMVHFNRIAHFGLMANLVSVPLMGLLVMPAALVAVLLMPFGLSVPALWVMGLGLRWILWVAHSVSDMEGAVGHVASPPEVVLPMMALGVLLVFLWQGRFRWVGLAPALLAGWIWLGADRPSVLIADDGRLVGVMTDTGRALSKGKGAGFVARVWLENDGDGATQIGAAGRWDGSGGLMPEHAVAGVTITHLLGKRGLEAFVGCGGADIVVTSERAPADAGCRILDDRFFRDNGAVALHLHDGKLELVTVRDLAGDRLWSPPPARKRPRFAVVQ